MRELFIQLSLFFISQREVIMHDYFYEKGEHGGTSMPNKVEDEINRLVEEEDLEYADNYRAYRIGNSKEHAAFNEATAEGCCGDLHWNFELDGVAWIVGCNFGH